MATPEKVRSLRQVLAGGRAHPVYQAIWNVERNNLLGYEALSRFDTDLPLDAQEAFEVAERIGHVSDLDALCRHAALHGAGTLPPGALLFVNLAPAGLGHPSLDDDTLLAQVGTAGLRPEQVVFEITERTAVDRSLLVRECSRLAALGFGLALDDVGAGNAGLELLRHLPVRFVKVDGDIVVQAASSPSVRAILHAVCAFAQQSGTYVIAEGIETPAQLDYLCALPHELSIAVQGAQGYLLGRPAPRLPLASSDVSLGQGDLVPPPRRGDSRSRRPLRP